MEQERKALRAGMTLILLAAVWRVAAGGAWLPFFQQPETAAFLVYLGTGRVVHPEAEAQTIPNATTSPTLPAQTEPEVLSFCFSQEDVACLSVYDGGGGTVDGLAMLQAPLDWKLGGMQPTVLIIHTHATESYTKNGESYVETARYRTRDTGYNMVRVGQQLKQRLEAAGIAVLHDTTLHDYPSYTGSYNNSRKAVEDYLAEYPSIKLVLDLHRDAALESNGKQMSTAVTVDGVKIAQMMLVVGSDRSGLAHSRWKENMALGVKLHVLLEKAHPGVTRPLCFRAQRFNQDLLPGMLLIEMGAAGDTLEQALSAADCLAEAIIALENGANLS